MMAELTKLDLSKSHKEYYTASQTTTIHEFGAIDYLSISGVSSPDAPLFVKSIEAIYPIAYTIKKYCKAEGNDFVVPKMECFWWVESELPFEQVPREEWYWKILIRMPQFVNTAHVEEAVQEVIEKKNPPLANEVTHEVISEGKCAQILHLGSYENEKTTIDTLHQFIADSGFSINGHHREVYLNDPRRTAPEKLRTIIRYAIK